MAFGSGLQSWAFTLNHFATLYAAKFKTDPEKLMKKMRSMEEKLVFGGQMMDRAALQEQELRRAQEMGGDIDDYGYSDDDGDVDDGGCANTTGCDYSHTTTTAHAHARAVGASGAE